MLGLSSYGWLANCYGANAAVRSFFDPLFMTHTCFAAPQIPSTAGGPTVLSLLEVFHFQFHEHKKVCRFNTAPNAGVSVVSP